MTQNFTLVRAEDGATATLAADHFATDGAGLRFYDAEGNVIANFAYGLIAEVRPAGVVFTAPAA